MEKIRNKLFLFLLDFAKWFIPTAICISSAIATIRVFEASSLSALRFLCIILCLSMPIMFNKWANIINEIEKSK